MTPRKVSLFLKRYVITWEFITTVMGFYFAGTKNERNKNEPEGDTIQMIHADVPDMPHVRSPDQ